MEPEFALTLEQMAARSAGSSESKPFWKMCSMQGALWKRPDFV